MLSSIILSLAMNASPVPNADVFTLDVEKTGTRIRINNEFKSEKTGTRIRINNEFKSEKTGTRIRINNEFKSEKTGTRIKI